MNKIAAFLMQRAIALPSRAVFINDLYDNRCLLHCDGRIWKQNEVIDFAEQSDG